MPTDAATWHKVAEPDSLPQERADQLDDAITRALAAGTSTVEIMTDADLT